MDRVFDDVGQAAWHITKKMMAPEMSKVPDSLEGFMSAACGTGCDPLTFASFWYSLFRTDQRSAMEKITVPLLYVMPETPKAVAERVKVFLRG